MTDDQIKQWADDVGVMCEACCAKTYLWGGEDGDKAVAALRRFAELAREPHALLIELSGDSPVPPWVADFLNRRAEVENALLKAASGKAPLPTQEQCREWALRLGVPEK